MVASPKSSTAKKTKSVSGEPFLIKNSIIGKIVGITWLVVWFAACIITAALQIVLCYPLALVEPRQAEFLTGWIGAKLFECLMLRWLVYSGYVKFVISGDCPPSGVLPKKEKAFVISNHRTFADWLPILYMASRSGILPFVKIFAKRSLLYIPGTGLCMYNMGFPMLARNWDKDQKRVVTKLEAMKRFGNPLFLLLFPEGTLHSIPKLEAGQKFAESRSLPVLQHLLFPKTKAFVSSIQSLHKDLDAVYDITLGYEGTSREMRDISIFKLISHQTTCVIHMHVRRIPRSHFPNGDLSKQEVAEKWCHTLFVEKDNLLDMFYKNGHFPSKGTPIPQSPVAPLLLKSPTTPTASSASSVKRNAASDEDDMSVVKQQHRKKKSEDANNNNKKKKKQ